MRAAETNINPLLVHVEGHSRERRHRIHNQQGTQFVRNFSVSIDASDNAGRSLPMRETDDLDLLPLARAPHVFGIYRPAVWRFNFYDLRRCPRPNLIHALGEDAVDRNDAFIAFFQRI